MKRSYILSQRVVVLLTILCAFACVASAATIYDVSGTFGTGGSPGSPLSGGTFTGTFTATLPTSGFETISTFNVNLINSSDAVLVNLTDLNAFAAVSPQSGCGTGASTTGPCDLFRFSNSLGDLDLITPEGFTGGATYTAFNSGTYFSAASVDVSSGDYINDVSSGSIEPTPECASLLLFGTGLLGAALLVRPKRRAERA